MRPPSAQAAHPLAQGHPPDWMPEERLRRRPGAQQSLSHRFARAGAVHSVEYDGLGAHFYLFGVRRASSGEWFAWDEVAALAHALELPHAPVWWRGTLTDLTQLKTLLRRAAARPKCPWPTARRPCGRPEAHPFARSLVAAL